MFTQKLQKIFDAAVRQDKGAPGRSYAALREPQYAAIPAQVHPKHHGSQRRRIREVSGCVSANIFDQIERMRSQGGRRLSRSAVVAALITRGMQEYADMQYGALLEPVIRKTIVNQMQRDTNRTAYLSSRSFYSAEETRLLVLRLLSLVLIDKPHLYEQYRADAKKQARLSLDRQNEDRQGE